MLRYPKPLKHGRDLKALDMVSHPMSQLEFKVSMQSQFAQRFPSWTRKA
jgi:hypothetical protein